MNHLQREETIDLTTETIDFVLIVFNNRKVALVWNHKLVLSSLPVY